MNTVSKAIDLPIEELVHPGNRACSGCGLSLIYRTALKALGRDTILVVPPSCLTVLQGLYPIAATQLPCVNVTFASTAAAASGVQAALRAQGRQNTLVAAWAGDGGTSDIGIQALSGACERQENFIYICYDNEAYMNTGVQRSGTTPAGALTTTTPLVGKAQQRKNVARIVAAHDIPYVATCSASYPLDLYNKMARARTMTGIRYFHIHTPCPAGWGFDPRFTVKMGKLAVETGLFELYEIENGRFSLTGASKRLLDKERTPVEKYFSVQSRFKVLPREQVERIQQETDRRWNELKQTQS
ncbi:MAG: thiamine pyrophosphate-dependent enzyme [Thermodesulfobacteriota bacterium]